ncbi:MAG: SDR family oxidoreductase [Chloroflexi bacterium]|nr:SDR family oxidoreductase [Chloroflexota bacterium]MCH8350228.1 SDR family oxidoreductase [Chloroflexota bacterium]MCI0797775.1 SDR family oxidoreductase [Chloroflexota bacterium]MCI0865209.1 SDR family oxidoreductase [Chloroflexota bacterium]MCI0877637.1 SDR family oxidoreductase [Chloroflexota bacterium]
MGRLEGKVALITAAGRGHGEAIARRFAKEGAAVAICDIIPVAVLEETVGEQIRAEGAQVLCFQTDVSQEEPVKQMVQQTLDQFGTIDILANVVGIAGPTKDVWDMSLTEWQETLAVNLDSVFLGCKYVLPEMIRKQYGRVINFSSGTGKQPLSHRAPYAASKMAVIGFTRTLAADVGRYNITVNAICPGGHEERSLELARGRADYLGEPFDEEAFRSRFRATPEKSVIAGRWCADEGYTQKGAGPEDAAAIALFLASDEAGNMTGQDINSGGGVMW